MDPIEPSRFGGPDGTGDAVYLLQRVGPGRFRLEIPFTGGHIPAMLVHDAMVLAPGEAPTYGGDTVDRIEADRILRDAMAHLGTRRLRRWLVWAAVAAATAQSCRTPRWWWRWAPFAWGLAIAAIGVFMSVFLLTGESLGLFGDALA